VGEVSRPRPERLSGPDGRGAALTTHPHPAQELKKEYNYISTPPLGLPGLIYSDVSLIHVICSRYKNFCIVQTSRRAGTNNVANSGLANNLQAGENVFALHVQF
jgi:hypothetical protein